MLHPPLILAGQRVRLEPLAEAHVPPLMAIAMASPQAFALTNTPLDETERDAYFGRAFRDRATGVGYPFAIVLSAEHAVVGMTRFNAIDASERRCDIGFTWMDPAYHGRQINLESKLLMLTHAFESMQVNRVQFQADERNLRSCRALERIGAKREGVLRLHARARDGVVRNSVIYSIIVPEWLEVKDALTRALAT